ncbi:hypothetical protein [Fulvivirga lutimaris]|uniref:hypothetical protein n=1 Tax=Fulvivirga lutimaris TaxID=1819566 RepID=UPI0012BB9935|nr:hypothetical protein [Fulvivirga lutimaris]MTI39878.1 hypothetical protein [Fulvivirga lutimaris]
MKRALIFLIFSSSAALAQSSYAPLNEDYYHWIDRYEIRSGEINPYFFSSLKAYSRKDIATFSDSIQNNDESLSEVDKFNLTYLSNDNWEWSEISNESYKPILKHFYKPKSDLYHVSEPDFDLHINPVLYLGAGQESSSDVKTFINTRGVEVRGMIDKKVGFYSFIGENQFIGPEYVRNYISNNLVVPHEGFWKGFKDDGVDYFTARGYINFNATKHIELQFGHDRFNVGNGYRSLILSDFAPASLFLRMNTKVWKLNYTNLFTQMTANIQGNSGGLTAADGYPNKYMAFHHLGLNIGKKLNIGIFESVIYSKPDSVGNNPELKYLNPIIFYRAIEQQNGSSDNVLLGLDFKWLAAKRISIYGQLVLDEFLLENIKEGNGWWANKFAFQLGGEYIDAFGISNLDLQAEANIARPYIYSHSSQYGEYSHYRQPLAHPLGANFKEYVGIVRYQPIKKLYLTGKLIAANYGADGEGENWGGNILLNNNTKEQPFGNKIGQGISTDLLMANFTASYQLKHNVFIDATLIHRSVKSELAEEDTNFTSFSLRWNIPQRLNEF